MISLRRVFAVLLLPATLLLSSCSCAPGHLRIKTEAIVSPLDPRLQAAWTKATTLADAPSNWREIPCVMLVRGVAVDTDGRRLYGKYITYVDLDAAGKFYVVEQIVVYLRPEEEEQRLEKVLTHEFLHVMWQRKQMDSAWRAAHPDSEEFVCSLGPCD